MNNYGFKRIHFVQSALQKLNVACAMKVFGPKMIDMIEHSLELREKVSVFFFFNRNFAG